MNRVWMTGRLTRDPEVKRTNSGKTVVNLGLATDRSIKNEQSGEWLKKTTFMDATIWGARGEAFAKHHSKGSPFNVVGAIEMDEWEDKTSGQKRTKLKLVIEEWEFATSKAQADGAAPSTSSPVPDDTPF